MKISKKEINELLKDEDLLKEEIKKINKKIRKVSDKEAEMVQDFYKLAMTRKRNYVFNFLWASVLETEDEEEEEGIFCYDPIGNLKLGCLCGFKKSQKVFAVSHFAPANLKAGFELMKIANEEEEIVFVFMVTEDLSPMLRKMGFFDTKYTKEVEWGESFQTKRMFISSNIFKNEELLKELESLYF